MRALIKNSRKILLNQVDPSERALIEEYISTSVKEVTTIRSLYDIDNELDGVSFELTGEKQGQINYTEPCIQVMTVGSYVKVNLEVDDDTNIRVDSTGTDDFLDVSVVDRLISIKALNNSSLIDTTGQFVLKAILTKEGYGTVVVPINVSVLYTINSGTRDYLQLYNQPKINGKVLVGDRELDELGIQEIMVPISDEEIDEMLSEEVELDD